MKNRLLQFTVIATMLLQSTLTFISCSSEKKEADYENEKEENENVRNAGAEKELSSWFQTKAYPDPTNLSKKYINAWEQAEELKNNNPFEGGVRRGESLGNWVATGPKVFGGRVLSLAINPTAAASGNHTIFAGSASGGIWKSYTEGVGATAWQPVTTGTNVLGVASIVYSPADTNILLAGTGEVYRVETYTNGPNSSNQVSNIGRNVWKARGTYGIGILRSANGGITWTNVFAKTISNLFGIQKIRFDPTNSNTVYACATDGLYKSTDAGGTWNATPLWSGTYVSDVIIDPNNNQNIVLAAGNVGNATKGIWKSTDGGALFTQITPGSFPTASKSGFRGSVNFAVAGTGSPYTLFASIGMNDLGSGYNVEDEVYRSTDFGSTWTVITGTNHASYQSWYSHLVTPYPVAGGTSTTKFFMAGVNKYVLTIAGSTGTATAVGTGSQSMSAIAPGGSEGANYLHADVHDIQFIPGSLTTAFFATDGGIFKTVNAGAAPITNITFSSCNGGLQIQQFYPTIAQSKAGTTVIGGLQDNTVIRYNGTNWQKIIAGDGGPCMFKPDNENIVLGSTDTRGVSASTNNGTSFPTSVLSYLGSIATPHDDRTSFMAPIAVSPNDPTRWYVASDNLHVSIFNTGTSTFGAFTNGSGVPSTNYIDALYKPAVAMGVSEANASKLFISTSPFAQDIANDNLHYNPPAKIRKTLDGGSTFSTVSASLPDRFVTDFAISKTFDDSVFITLSGFGTNHVYVTADGGGSWSPRGSGLPDVPFNTILIDPVDPRILYAGCDFKVYVSQDRGANWFDFSSGLWDATYVMDLVIAPGNKIRAVTHGKGIFESDLWTYLTMLPVQFNTFTAVNQGVMNNLEWVVEQESNLSHYEVERSTDGFDFSKIKQIAAKNNVTRTVYTASEFIGNSPLPGYYYRIRSVSADGTFMYSNIVKVKISGKSKFEVMGNPFTNSLTVRYTVPQTGKLQINLLDMQGRFLKKEEFLAGTGNGTYTLNNLSGFPAGTYLLNLEMENTRTTYKVIKQ